MARIHKHRFLNAAAECLAGIAALSVITVVCFQLQASQAATTCLYLIVIVVVSLRGRFLSAVVVSLAAVGLLNYYFVEPIFEFSTRSIDYIELIAFLITSAAMTHFASRVRKGADELRDKADLLNLTHDTIFVRDMNDLITYWNNGAQLAYGWIADEVVGKQTTHQLLKTVFPEPLDDITAELVNTGRWEGELAHTRRDGTQIVVASRWTLKRNEEGKPVAILETNNDITERKQAEDQLRKLNDELEQRVVDRTAELEAINKELEAFTYSVSHDLRAPLRHMVGYTELLQKNAFDVLDEKSRRYVFTVLEATKRMGNLIDDLLAFSRVGRTEMQKSVVSLEQLVKEALSELQPELETRDVAWTIGALPEVYGDRSMLRLALVNLISNAVKFTGTREKAEIEVGCTDEKEDEIVVFIKDNGVGFQMAYKNKLFGVFQRLHRAEEFEGTGIGLASVQRIMHRHGGRVWADSIVDKGATFYFSVPKNRIRRGANNG